MKQMIASWFMVMIHGLIVAGSGIKSKLARSWARETNEPPGAFRARAVGSGSVELV
jgi:hypothetical protein